MRKIGQVVNNSIIVARFLFETSNYILPILVLLEILNKPEEYLAVWRIIPPWNMESQNEDEFDLNACSDDKRIIDRILYKKRHSI